MTEIDGHIWATDMTGKFDNVALGHFYAFNKELLASHIRGCVARDIREGKDEVIDELVATLQKLMK